MENKNYFLGLDIGTDSVGYAATDTSPDFHLIRRRGAPVWGVTLFEAANLCDERRAHRTDRRRIDRRQQRVLLLQEIFAKEIGAVDESFFRRIRESALFREDGMEENRLFHDPGYTDADYHRQYPTIHHLIMELIENSAPHDIRLVYLACAWLVVHRGHFLSDVSPDNVTALFDFLPAYRALLDYCRDAAEEGGYAEPWMLAEGRETEFGEILKLHGVQKKKQAFRTLLYEGKKIPKTVETSEGAFPFSVETMLGLLAGGKGKLSDLYRKEEYEELGSFSLDSSEEEYQSMLSELGDDGELLRRMKALYDWGVLCDLRGGQQYISRAKVEVYNRHRQDLADLKAFVRENYEKDVYSKIFRRVETNNYVAYSGNIKSVKKEIDGYKKCESRGDFCAFLRKTLALDKEENRSKMPEKMLERIQNDSFMPKQVTGDNRVLPYQLYYSELQKILETAKNYLHFLGETDESGYRTDEKILSIMKYRIPYYVGPLNPHGENAWIRRHAEGKIYPWNFDKMVNLEASEQAFIDRMTNTCTYLAGEDVLPQASLLYQKFTVLNEINNIKIHDVRIDTAMKQKIYNDLFMTKKKVTRRALVNYLCQNGIPREDLEKLSGIDLEIKSSLSSYVVFRRLLEGGVLTPADAEKIIRQKTYCEEAPRFRKWLDARYPGLSDEDRRYLSSLNIKGFGRLSERLLSGIEGTDTETGETMTVIAFLWEKSVNLSELLLSDRYTFSEIIREENAAYFEEHPRTLTERLNDMYVSNAVKRPIIRTLDIVADVVKAAGGAPQKIFVEMARGAKEEEKHKRTKTRREQLLEYYDRIRTEEVRVLRGKLEGYGDEADNKLQSDRLFLYYLQLGKCMYTGEPIEIGEVLTKRYDIDHIYPQSRVDDDSILNNKVLVLSVVNKQKDNKYPIDSAIRQKMHPFWEMLKNNGLITEEKYRRLTRETGFTAEEEWGFVNRQLVETRQSTKVITTLLGEKYPGTEIVFVKAGLVSEFRHKFDLLKSRAVNDLHHAKDAYLNIVCGQVYHTLFTKQWFLANRESREYTQKKENLFGREQKRGEEVVWRGGASLAAVKETIRKNNCHLTMYTFCRHGKLFAQQPLKKQVGLIPRKANLPTEIYGGYQKPTATFFVLALCSFGKKRDLLILPVDLMVVEKYRKNSDFAKNYLRSVAENIVGKPISNISFPLGERILKINTVFEADGFRMCLASKSSGGQKVGMKPLMPLILSPEWEFYIKKLESFHEKLQKNPHILHDEQYDALSGEKNRELYLILADKLSKKPFSLRPELSIEKFDGKEEEFAALDFTAQVTSLLNLVSLFARSAAKDPFFGFTGDCRLNSKLSNWKNKYTSVCIVDASASGIWEYRSDNLLSLI